MRATRNSNLPQQSPSPPGQDIMISTAQGIQASGRSTSFTSTSFQVQITHPSRKVGRYSVLLALLSLVAVAEGGKRSRLPCMRIYQNVRGRVSRCVCVHLLVRCRCVASEVGGHSGYTASCSRPSVSAMLIVLERAVGTYAEGLFLPPGPVYGQRVQQSSWKSNQNGLCSSMMFCVRIHL